MKGQMVAVDQAANIGIQFQGETKRPSRPAIIIWSDTDEAHAGRDAADKAGYADNGPIGAATKATGAGMGPWDPFGIYRTGG